MAFTYSDEEAMFALFAALSVFIILAIIIGTIIHIVSAYSIMKLAGNAGVENGWFAFIPFLNLYVIGELLSSKLGGKGGAKLLTGYIIAFILSLIPIVGILSCIAMFLASIIITYWLFQRFTAKAGLYTLLSFLTAGIAFAICLYKIRNNQPLS